MVKIGQSQSRVPVIAQAHHKLQRQKKDPKDQFSLESGSQVSSYQKLDGDFSAGHVDFKFRDEFYRGRVQCCGALQKVDILRSVVYLVGGFTDTGFHVEVQRLDRLINSGRWILVFPKWRTYSEQKSDLWRLSVCVQNSESSIVRAKGQSGLSFDYASFYWTWD